MVKEILAHIVGPNYDKDQRPSSLWNKPNMTCTTAVPSPDTVYVNFGVEEILQVFQRFALPAQT